uniref:Uncharacterized protein n=1 Tax=Anguilla anguilla TaxID=7936 RepID=A0A0E9TC07_ANGAN
MSENQKMYHPFRVQSSVITNILTWLVLVIL